MVTKFDHNLVVSENVELVNCQLLVGAKHLEDKLSVIAKNSSANASPVQLLVGAKHLEDKLSVIAKNSCANASPVQLLVAKKYFSSLFPVP
jgi:hypothetical protein